jgi:hypothetical protein
MGESAFGSLIFGDNKRIMLYTVRGVLPALQD